MKENKSNNNTQLNNENLDKVAGGIIDDNFKASNDTFYGPSEIKENEE